MTHIESFNVAVRDSLFHPRHREEGSKAYYRKSSKSDRIFYKVHIFIVGKDLPFVKEVRYTLHKTFKSPKKTIRRTIDNPFCVLTIWTWGIFTIKADIIDIGGNVIRVKHHLTYGDQIKKGKLNFEENSTRTD